MHSPAEIIAKKRDGGALSREELKGFIHGFLAGEIRDYQMSALLMAIFLNGMTREETVTLTEIMLRSGEVIDLSAIPGIKVDKHSTGGVGDKVSLILAPMVAACGVPVPMISGRGLGHTGGTLDKLETIPGFNVHLDIAEYKRVIEELGVVMIGQTAEIAPADKELYALRDVTGTVESIPLIASSIMSKKLAEGIDALVLDIKTGAGAFMKTFPEAAELGKTLVAIGEDFGKRTVGFITDMSEPLGRTVGNWLEVRESVECLQGSDAAPDLMEVTYVLGGAMVHLGGKAGSISEGIDLCREAIRSGRAMDRFVKLAERQGGDGSVLRDPASYREPAHQLDVTAAQDGIVREIQALEVGLSAIGLGAGRQRKEDVIDPTAGIVLHRKVGDRVQKGDRIATVMSDRAEALDPAARRVRNAYSYAAVGAPIRASLILKLIDRDGLHDWSH